MPNTLTTALGLKSHNEAGIKILVIISSQTYTIALEFFVINIIELQLRLKTALFFLKYVINCFHKAICDLLLNFVQI